MRKANLVLIILLMISIGACSNKKAFHKDIEMPDYKAPAETILEINKKAGTFEEKEAAELNLNLIKEESIVKKALILNKMNNLSK